MAEKVLEVNNLTVSFSTDNGLVRAVRGVSFDLEKGETLCIVGESGSGKSVTSKAIMGILANNAIIDDGTIMYEGENLLEISEEEYVGIRGHKIGMIFQDPLSSLNPIVKIGKQITEATLINNDKLKDYYNKLINRELMAYKNISSVAKSRIHKIQRNLDHKIDEIKKASKNDAIAKETSKAEVAKLKAEAKAQIMEIENDRKARLVPAKNDLIRAKAEAKIKVKEYHNQVKQEYKTSLTNIKAKYQPLLADIEKNYEQSTAAQTEDVKNKEVLLANANAKLNELLEKKSKTSKNDLVTIEEINKEIKEAQDICKEAQINLKKAQNAKFYAKKELLKSKNNEILAAKTKYIDSIKITRKEAKRRALEIMKEVGIPFPEKRFKQYPFEFSGGMRQRIVIAIALTANPDILICDEPTTALDVTIQAQILELINKLKRERNLSCVFITHDLGVVANMADRVAVMYAGKIVEYGKVNEIFYEPKHPYTWALLSSIPDVDSKERLEAIPGTPPNMIYPPKGDAFAARNRYAMEIDLKYQPPYFKVSDTHYAATWLLHPNAPKVEMPKIVQARIQKALEGGELNE